MPALAGHRPVAPTPVRAQQYPWYVVRVVFPLVAFELRVRLTLGGAAEEEEGAVVVEQEAYRFEAAVLDAGGAVLRRLPVTRLGRAVAATFVEGEGAGLTFNGAYRLRVRDLDGVYADAEEAFVASELRRSLTLRLAPRPPARFRMPAYGAALLAAGLLAACFLAYAQARLLRLLREARSRPAPGGHMDAVRENLARVLLRQERLAGFRERQPPTNQRAEEGLAGRDGASRCFADGDG